MHTGLTMNRRRIVSALAFAALAVWPNPVFAVAQTPTPAGDSAIFAPRLVPLAGVQNFRDIGGYRTLDGRHVAWGRIYRSAQLSHLTPADLTVVARLNIHTVYDLRSVSERRAEPTAWIGSSAPTILMRDYDLDLSAMAGLYQGTPTVDGARAVFVNLYATFLDTQRPQQAALFEVLLRNDGASLYHCTAGKDRTGLATAMILSALGVPRETILYDYELSNRYVSGVNPAGAADPSQARRQAGSGRLPPDVAAVFMRVDAAYLRAVFAQIDRDYGSIETYLDQRLGVDADDIRRLKALYTE